MAYPHHKKRYELDADTAYVLLQHLERLKIVDSASDTDSSWSSSDLTPADAELNSLLSFDEDRPADERPPDEPWTKIGAGSCGAVFARSADGKSFALKLSKTKDHQRLWDNYVVQANLVELFDLCKPRSRGRLLTLHISETPGGERSDMDNRAV